MMSIAPGIMEGVVDVLVSRGWLNGPTRDADSIHDAIEAFQDWSGRKNAGGELDLETLEDLSAPRFCALHDRLPQTAGVCKWPDGNIPYFVKDAFAGISLEKTWEAFDWALGEWAKAGKLKPARATSAASARIVAGIAKIDGPNGVLAQSYLPCGNTRQTPQEYDTAEAWSNEWFCRIVVLHELGHALGIPHAPGKGSIMSPYYDPALKSLQAWDVAEIVKRYGAATPTPDPIPTPGNKIILYHSPLPSGWTIEVRPQ